MVTPVHTHDEMPSFRPRLYGIIFLVAVIAFGGLGLVSRIANMDAARDHRQWQDKLNLIVESRKADISGWVRANFKELGQLADNPSMQLYVTELQMGESAPRGEEPAQKTYIRNMLSFIADRMGFEASQNSNTVPASIAPTNQTGIAVIDNSGKIIVSTLMVPPQQGLFAEAIASAAPGQRHLLDMKRTEDGTLLVGFVLPVYGIQGEQTPEGQIARVVAIREADATLFDLLRHPGVTEKTLEVSILRREGDQVQYLSPLMDGSKPLEKMMSDKADMWAEAFAVAQPGSFETRLDYRTTPVFITARAVDDTPWVVMAKIDKSEALADSAVRRTGMIVMLLLALVVVIVTIVLVWRQATLRRSQVLSRRFKLLADRATAQEQMLRLVTDKQSEAVYIVDHDQHYQFANKKAAEMFGMSPAAIRGKTVVDVMGTARAAPLLAACEETMNRQDSTFAVRHIQDSGAERVIRAEHIPLQHIPDVTIPEGTPGVLVVEQDVTELVQERERRLRDHKQLLDTLIMLVDKRDPNAANHSALVSFVAGKVAESLQLDTLMRDTTQLAGSLMNIGKIVISEQVLTKADRLNEEEKRSIRDSIYASADVLSGIPFEGPVVETLRQSQEHYDGTGPKGMKGEDILISARIIAVANSFVGMVSKRAWRAALPIDQAVKMLLEQVDRQYDRRIVVALADYIENKGGQMEVAARMKNSRKAA